MSSPTIRVLPNAAALTTVAAHHLTTAAQTAVANHGRFAIALSGGSTPQALFTLLAEKPYVDLLPWTRMHVFWGDERLVPPDDTGSNFFHAHALLLAHVPVPAGNIHRVRGEWPPARAEDDYAQQLRAFAGEDQPWPRFDLALMGLGSDGHTASLFPGPIPAAEARQPVMTVSANYAGRPARRLTLTPPVFNDARQVLFLVAGASKAPAVAAVLAPTGDPQQWPARRIQPTHGTTTWLLDAAAAAHLP